MMSPADSRFLINKISRNAQHCEKVFGSFSKKNEIF